MQKEMTMKKTLTTALLVSAVLAFMSCGFGSGDIKTTGNKWNTTMTINGLDEKGGITSDSKDSAGILLGTNYKTYYKRVWEQIGDKEQVAEITSTITVDLAKSKLKSTDGNRNAVFGLAFDLDTNKAGSTNGDFCLVGIRQNPNNNKFEYYFERYTEITPAKKASGITQDNALGSYFSFTGGTAGTLYKYDSSVTYANWTGSSNNATSIVDWVTLPAANYTYAPGTSFSVNLYITQQTPGKYEVYLGKSVSQRQKLGEFNITPGPAQDKTQQVTNISANYKRYGPAKQIGGSTYLTGGIACYGSTPFDTKLVVNYKQDKDSLKGALFAEEE